MKLALLMGNRFNPWHLKPFAMLPGAPDITAFRAESEIQQYFHERDDGTLQFAVEPIYFDTQAGNPIRRVVKTLLTRYAGREPRIVPFSDRLKGFDLIQTWELFTDWSAEALIAHERLHVPLAVMFWDNIPFNMERDEERRERKRRVAAAADAIIVYTERSRRTLAVEGVPLSRVVKINPGLDTEAFSPGEKRRGGLGLSDDEFVILFVGWFLPRKGLDFLLFALREMLNDPALQSTRFRLLLVGSGPGRERVEQLVERLGIGPSCTFAGSLPYNRMPDVFRAADVFVLPSIATPEWQEQFGMALIEALACGTPTIATLSGAIPEIAGDCALLCQPNDFVSLCDAVKRLARNPAQRQDLAQAARARAVQEFAMGRHVAALSDVYGRLLG